jgi:hypothetical protein
MHLCRVRPPGVAAPIQVGEMDTHSLDPSPLIQMRTMPEGTGAVVVQVAARHTSVIPVTRIHEQFFELSWTP